MEQLTGVHVLIGIVVLVLGPSGAAFVGIRAGLNGMRASQRRMEKTVDALAAELKTLTQGVNDNRNAIGRLDERVDAHAGWIRRVEDLARDE